MVLWILFSKSGQGIVDFGCRQGPFPPATHGKRRGAKPPTFPVYFEGVRVQFRNPKSTISGSGFFRPGSILSPRRNDYTSLDAPILRSDNAGGVCVKKSRTGHLPSPLPRAGLPGKFSGPGARKFAGGPEICQRSRLGRVEGEGEGTRLPLPGTFLGHYKRSLARDSTAEQLQEASGRRQGNENTTSEKRKLRPR